MVLEIALLDCAVGLDHFPLPIQFIILKLALLYSAVHKILSSLPVQLVAFENTLLKRFLININAKAVEAVLAIIVTNHLAREGPLLLLRMINDPHAANINLLTKIISILNGH